MKIYKIGIKNSIQIINWICYFSQVQIEKLQITNFDVQFLLPFIGAGGKLRQGSFLYWHCGPSKFCGQLHRPGAIQIPLFWQWGKQTAKICTHVNMLDFTIDLYIMFIIYLRWHGGIFDHSEPCISHSPSIHWIINWVSPLGNWWPSIQLAMHFDCEEHWIIELTAERLSLHAKNKIIF